MNMVDVVILAVVAVVLALIVRGLVRGTIRTCDSDSCAGDCGSCGHACANPRIHLSREQRRRLRELDQLQAQASTAADKTGGVA